MAILRSLHHALNLAQSDERAVPVLRYLLLHALRPLLADIQNWLVGVQREVRSRLSQTWDLLMLRFKVLPGLVALTECGRCTAQAC